jgi:hypothetical protein
MAITATLKNPPAHTAMPPQVVTLDQRVTKILNDPNVDHLPSSTFSAVVAEVNAEDWRARAARERALDPTLDGVAERSRAEDLQFQSGRLVAGRARLLEYGRTAKAREQLTAWHSKADAVEVTRDKVAALLAERYTALTTAAAPAQ